MSVEKKINIVIINGGKPLKDCPVSWEKAKDWQINANNGVDPDFHEDEMKPLWSWDCGFKLDYDGEIVSISSRFYPPKTHS